ncbi:MAG: 16S rRNA (uracil(1498)-N(3))-methyltransferase [Rhodocyclaceae bacterium]|nr:16S rRNA (uracil(1498)-N(3))-methyltransferase [Rhodocyclaceae bacterium]
MTFPRFFCPGPLAPGAVLALPEGAAAHAARVLRLTAGDALTLFDGRGGEYGARIAAVRKDAVDAEVLAWRERECEAPLSIRLVQALQTGDKMDLTVQKAVELGVAAIQPVASRRSVVRLDGERAARRVAHWRGVAVAACEQCGRNRVPEVAAIEPLERWLARPAEAPLRLMLSPTAEIGLRQLPPARSLDLLIGAEGGLDPAEAAMAAAAGFVGVRLGPRVLRTETAGLAALAAIQTLWGDFGEEG